jgi:hypothetical protein
MRMGNVLWSGTVGYRVSTSDGIQRARLGLRHVTVVPSNYERGDADDESAAAEDR